MAIESCAAAVPAESSGGLAPDNQPHASRGSRLTLLQACAHAPPISRLVLGQRVRRAQDESPLAGAAESASTPGAFEVLTEGDGAGETEWLGNRLRDLVQVLSHLQLLRRVDGEVARDTDNLDAGSLAAAPCDARQYLAQLCSRHGVDGTFELNAHAAIDTTIGATTLSSLSVISEPNGRSGTVGPAAAATASPDVEPLFKWQLQSEFEVGEYWRTLKRFALGDDDDEPAMRLAPTLRLLLPDLMQPSQWWTDGTARNASAKRKTKEKDENRAPSKKGKQKASEPSADEEPANDAAALRQPAPTDVQQVAQQDGGGRGSDHRRRGRVRGRARGRGGVGGRGASSLGGQGTAAAPQRCEELPTALQHALAELDDATAADMQEEVENDAISGPLACASQRLKQILMQAASGPSDEQPPCQARALVQTVGAEFRPDVVRAAFEALVKRGWLVSASVDESGALIGLSSAYLDALRALATARAPVCPAPAPASNDRPAPADASAPAGAASHSNGLCAEFWRQCETARADGESDDQPLASARAHHGGSVAVLFDTLASGRYELQPKYRAPASASSGGVAAAAGTGDVHLVDFLDDVTASGPCPIDVVRRLDRTSVPAVSEGVAEAAHDHTIVVLPWQAADGIAASHLQDHVAMMMRQAVVGLVLQMPGAPQSTIVNTLRPTMHPTETVAQLSELCAAGVLFAEAAESATRELLLEEEDETPAPVEMFYFGASCVLERMSDMRNAEE